MKFIITTIIAMTIPLISYGEDVVTINKPAIIQTARAAALVEIRNNPDIEFSFLRLAYFMEPPSASFIMVYFEGLENEKTDEDADKVTTRKNFKTISVQLDEHGQVIKVNKPTPSQSVTTIPKSVQQSVPGYPPQGVGSPEP